MRWQLLWCKLAFSRTTRQDPETSPERSDGTLGGNVPLAPVQEKNEECEYQINKKQVTVHLKGHFHPRKKKNT